MKDPNFALCCGLPGMLMKYANALLTQQDFDIRQEYTSLEDFKIVLRYSNEVIGPLYN